MSIKINHYARPINTNVKSIIEASFIELFIGVICACFAYFTYDNTIVLFVSTALIATVCLGLTIYNVYTIIQDIRWQKQQQNLAADVNSSGK